MPYPFVSNTTPLGAPAAISAFFTDAVGDDAYNLKLSEDRAASVKTALVSLGPPKGVVFETKGYGKANPVASNDTEAGRALNRRVEVFIKP